MSDPNDFIIIDEKPKRDQRKRKPKPYQPSSVFIALMSLMAAAFSLGICSVLFAATSIDDGVGDDWTGTAIVATNQSILEMATLTQNALLVPTVMPCSFMWASQDLPAVTTVVQSAFNQVAALRGVQVRANAYGETCGSNFLAMTTDFYLTVDQGLTDDAAAMELIVAAVDVLTALLEVELPAHLGYFDITLTIGAEQHTLRLMFNEFARAREQGHTGTALLEALGGWR
jgi:hypothetical protein